MSLRVEKPFRFSIFEFIRCPVCNGSAFTSYDHGGCYCDKCNAKFQPRPTAGDPGIVVDVYIDDCYAPRYECKGRECAYATGFYSPPDQCPCGLSTLKEVSGFASPLSKPDDHSPGRPYYYGVFKLGDYCSAWSHSHNNHMHKAEHSMTQEEWDKFQETFDATLHSN